jgi:hypothetical protein
VRHAAQPLPFNPGIVFKRLYCLPASTAASVTGSTALDIIARLVFRQRCALFVPRAAQNLPSLALARTMLQAVILASPQRLTSSLHLLLARRYAELRRYCATIPCFVVANKIDVDYSVTTKSFAFATKHSLPLAYVSAADGTNVVKTFRDAIEVRGSCVNSAGTVPL